MTTAAHFTAAEFFAGIGLMRMGLEYAGWQVIYANDWSKKKHQMYDNFFPGSETHYIIDDIFNINPEAIPQSLLATCSFPCIDLSIAGKMNGIGGSHSGAFWGFVRVLEGQGQLAPPLILIENVPGWLQSNNGNDFRIAVQALNDLGYMCDIFLLNAMQFTPQSRPRVFLIGQKNTNQTRDHSVFLNRSPLLFPRLLYKSIQTNSDLGWLYINIPDPPPLKTDGLGLIAESIPELDKRWWPQDKIRYHLDMMTKIHRERVDKLINSDLLVYRTFYRRTRGGQQRAEVRADDTAGCLRTASGGSAKQFIIRVGGGSILMRDMTPREYARLQGVPDSYTINTDITQALTGFGDAVCVPAITWITHNILTPLAECSLIDRTK